MPDSCPRAAARAALYRLARTLGLAAVLLAGFGSASAYAAGLTVTPLTWNVIGLDSNAPTTSGPDTFPVGARVCNNTGATQSANTATFVWDSTPSPNYITLTSPAVVSLPTLAPGSCYDAYYTVVVSRSTSAMNFTRRFEIDFSLGSGSFTAATPTPRELYVEHLVSQNRNSVVKYSGPGGCDSTLTTCDPVPSTWVVGQTYTVKLYSSSSTAYDQEEAFINFPGNAFEVVSAAATYSTVSAPASGSSSSMYNDACTWDPKPLSSTYKSCLGTGKAGGNIVTTYQVRAISANASATLHAMIQDFSGSSYHYNTDYNSSSSGLTITAQFPLGVTRTGSGVGTVSSTPAGITCGSTCTGSYAAGTAVTLTASPASGSTFTGWSGACTGTSATCQVTMSQAVDVTAQFEPVGGAPSGTPDLTVSESHSGTFTQGDAADTHTVTVSNSGTADTNGSPVTLAETAPTGEAVTAIAGPGWTCTLSTLTCTRSDVLAAGQSYPSITITVAIDPNAPATLTNSVSVDGGGEVDTTNDAASDPTPVLGSSFPLAVALSGAGSGSVSDAGQINCLSACGGTYANGSQVTLTATPASGSAFTGWSGACTGTSATCVVTMSQALSVTADFAQLASVPAGAPDLAISESHNGTFSQGDPADDYAVTVSNAGTAPTSGAPVTFTETPPAGETVTALSGSGWTCVLATLTCTRSDVLPTGQSYPAITVTVAVDANAPAIVVSSVSVSGGGAPQSAGAQATDPTPIASTPQTLAPTGPSAPPTGPSAAAPDPGSPATGSQTSGDPGTSTSTSAPGAGTAPAGTHRLDVSIQGSGAITAGDGTIHCGSACTNRYATSAAVPLTATPAPGWRLARWQGACTGTSPTCRVTMNADRSVSATFERLPPPRAHVAISEKLDRPAIDAGGAATLAISLRNASDHPVRLTLSVPLPADVTVAGVPNGRLTAGRLEWRLTLRAHSSYRREARLRIGGASRTLRFTFDAAGRGVRLRMSNGRRVARLQVTRISHDARPTG